MPASGYSVSSGKHAFAHSFSPDAEALSTWVAEGVQHQCWPLLLPTKSACGYGSCLREPVSAPWCILPFQRPHTTAFHYSGLFKNTRFRTKRMNPYVRRTSRKPLVYNILPLGCSLRPHQDLLWSSPCRCKNATAVRIMRSSSTGAGDVLYGRGSERHSSRPSRTAVVADSPSPFKGFCLVFIITSSSAQPEWPGVTASPPGWAAARSVMQRARRRFADCRTGGRMRHPALA